MTRRPIEGLRGIVTGASGGIGAAIARELVRSGAAYRVSGPPGG